MLLFTFLIGVYIKHSMTLNSYFIPYHISLISGFTLLLLNVSRIRINELLLISLFYISVVYISILSLQTGYFVERLNGFIQLFFVLGASYGFFLEISQKNNNYFSNLSKYIICIILVFCVFELCLLTRPFIESIQIKIHGYDEHLYKMNLLRDQVIGLGYNRPKVFSSETSHVAMFSFIFSSIWYLTTDNKRKLFWFVLLSIMLFILVRSPILIFNFVYLIFHMFTQKRLLNIKNILGIFMVVLVIAIVGNYLMFERIGNIFSGMDNSAYTRVFRPFHFIYLSFIHNPLFGSGLLNNEYLLKLYLQNTGDYSTFDRFIEGNIYVLNNFGAHFSYFGIIGSLLIGTVLIKMFKKLMIKHNIMFYFILFLISITVGSYAGQRMWGFIFLLLATFRSLNTNTSYFPNPKSDLI